MAHASLFDSLRMTLNILQITVLYIIIIIIILVLHYKLLNITLSFIPSFPSCLLRRRTVASIRTAT